MRTRIAAAGACYLLAVGCGSKSAPPPTTSTTTSAATTKSSADEQREREANAERVKKEQIVASHRKAELEQQNAMAASCSEPKPWTKHERCLPSCYPTQAPAAAAETKLAGPTELEHIVCRRDGDIPFAVVDELDPKLRVVKVRGRFPKPHRKGSPEATLATWFAENAKLAKGDVVVVDGKWRSYKHPLSRESLSCVKVSHYTKALKGKLGDCAAGTSAVTCEATGNGAARAINVVHYRLAEAKRLQAANKAESCQQAALEAIAVARGLPRWRQYKKLNVDEWNDKLLYKTRFDGIVDEDTLFAIVTGLGSEAESIFAACGGASATTNVDQEQSFHMCW